MARTRIKLVGCSHDIKEEWYYTAVSLVRPVNVMAADTYPSEKRERTLSTGAPNPFFDPEVAEEYSKAYRRIQNFLYEQRNRVNDEDIPRFEIHRVSAKPEDTRAAQELRRTLVEGRLDRLYENLVAYSPILVGERYVKSVQETLKRVYAVSAARLTEYLISPSLGSHYQVEYAAGVYPIETNLDLEEIQYETTPRLHPNHPSLRETVKE